MLANLIKSSNEKVDKLINVASQQSHILRSIEENTATSAYYNGISAINTSYIAWLAYKNSTRDII